MCVCIRAVEAALRAELHEKAVAVAGRLLDTSHMWPPLFLALQQVLHRKTK
jgi:hypothetical protein